MSDTTDWAAIAQKLHQDCRQLERELAEVTKQRDVLLEGLEKIASLDFVITLPNRMDAVRIIAYGTLNKIKHDTEPTTHHHLPRG